MKLNTTLMQNQVIINYSHQSIKLHAIFKVLAERVGTL